jgi:hypothetical protein
MRLAEALAWRAELKNQMEQLAARTGQFVRVQEGETPDEDANALMAEHARLVEQFEKLIVQINKTNIGVEVTPRLSMTEALAKRDALRIRHRYLTTVVGEKRGGWMMRSTASELRMVTLIDVPEIRKQLGSLAHQLRELDNSIQQANWNNDLIEN